MAPVVSDYRTDTDLSKMKFLILTLCVYAVSAAPQRSPFKPAVQAAKVAAQVVASPVVAAAAVAKSVAGSEYDAQILRSESDVGADGFNYIYETNNGISAQATGVSKKVDNQDVIVVQGSYQYQSPDGTPVQFSYQADENGYQPQSDSLPTPPPVPEAILRSLEYIAAHPPPAEPKRI